MIRDRVTFTVHRRWSETQSAMRVQARSVSYHAASCERAVAAEDDAMTPSFEDPFIHSGRRTSMVIFWCNDDQLLRVRAKNAMSRKEVTPERDVASQFIRVVSRSILDEQKTAAIIG